MSRTRTKPDHPVVMTIAGSDPSGGAGIQADLKTFTALQCYGTSVITALVAENTQGVLPDGVFPTPPEFIEKQLNSVLTDMSVAAVKTGMLFDAANARAVANGLKSFYNTNATQAQAQTQTPHDTSTSAPTSRRSSSSVPIPVIPPIVIDPVCVSTSGHSLLEPDALGVMIEELFPLAKIVTPNKSECEVLLAQARGSSDDKKEIRNVQDAVEAARELGRLVGCDVLLKGGHLTVSARELTSAFSTLCSRQADDSDRARVDIVWEGLDENMEILQTKSREALVNASLVIDVLYEHRDKEKEKEETRETRETKRGEETTTITVFARTRIESTSTHGTGCTLSAAIACYLARGYSVMDAVRLASDYTHTGIKTAFPLGKGHGPLNHMHSITSRVLPLPSKEDPYPLTRALIRSNAGVWKSYVEHPFVRQMGEGTLKRESFLHFVKQDYQYLKYYARAYGLLVAKSKRFADIKPATDTILNVLNEVTLHRSYCNAELGITEDELEHGEESSATTAYGAFLLDSGLQGDETHLIITLAACLLGYGEVGLWLKTEAAKPNSWVQWAGNPYLRWIEDYAGPHYQNAVRNGLDILELAAREDPPSPRRFEQWKEVWGKCTLLEKRFWDMAMDLS